MPEPIEDRISLASESSQFTEQDAAVTKFRGDMDAFESYRDTDPEFFDKLWSNAKDFMLSPFKAWSPEGGQQISQDMQEKTATAPEAWTAQDVKDFAEGVSAPGLTPAEGKSNAFSWGRIAAGFLGADDRAIIEKYNKRSSEYLAKTGDVKGSLENKFLNEAELDEFTQAMSNIVLPGVGMMQRIPGKLGAKISPGSSEAANNVLGRTEAQVKQTMQAIGFDPDKPLVEITERLAQAGEQAGMEMAAREAADTLPLALHIPLGDKAANFNLAQFGDSESLKAAIKSTADAMAPELLSAKRGVVSHEQTLAEALGVPVERILGRKQGQAMNAAEIALGGQLVAAGAENLRGLAIKAFSPMGTEADKTAYKVAFAAQSALMAQFGAGAAEAGRALNAMQIAKQGSAKAMQAMQEIMGLADDQTARQIGTMLAALPNAGAINKFVRESQKSTWKDVLFTLWMNVMLLSSPKTHMANFIGNTVSTALQMPERALAAGISSLTGSEAVKIAEVGAQAHGLIEGFKDGLKSAARVMQTGQADSMFTPLEGRSNAISAKALDLSGVPGRAADVIGRVVSTPGTALEASDSFFKAINYRSELNAQAVRVAIDEVNAGSSASKAVQELIDKGAKKEAIGLRVQEILADPPVELHMKAMDWARYQTYQQGLGKAGNMAMGLREAVPGASLVVPFMRTPINIAKFTAERTPLALISPAVWRDLQAGGVAREMAISKMSLGSMVLAAAGYYSVQGRLTGSGPMEPRLREEWEKAGNLPYSVKIGDEWYSFNRLDPYGSILGLAGDIHDIIRFTDDRKDAELAAAAGALALIRTCASKTFISGAANLMEVLDKNEPVQGVLKYLQRTGAGFVTPAFMAEAERAIDPEIRATYSLLDVIKSRTPGLSKDLPPRRGVFGEPTTVPESWGPDWLIPIATRETQGAPVYAELLRLNLPLSKARKVMNLAGGQVELDPQKYDTLLRLAGNEAKDEDGMGFRDAMEALLNGTHPDSLSYKSATDGPDGGKAMIIKRIQHAYMEKAKAMMLTDEHDPDHSTRDAWKGSILDKMRNRGAEQ